MPKNSECNMEIKIGAAFAIVIGSHLIALLFSDTQLRKTLTDESLIEISRSRRGRAVQDG